MDEAEVAVILYDVKYAHNMDIEHTDAMIGTTRITKEGNPTVQTCLR